MEDGYGDVKKTMMAAPFADPRTGQLYFWRVVPEARHAKVAFARENAAF
jgi:hypothetical protein